MITELDPQLLALAASQGGTFTTSQARTVSGLTHHILQRLVRLGVIARLTRGLYAVCSPPEDDEPTEASGPSDVADPSASMASSAPPAPPASPVPSATSASVSSAVTPEDRHRQFCRGALLLYPDGVLSGVSAALAHGLPLWNCDLSRPIVRRDAKKGTGAVGIRIRRAAPAITETDMGPAVPAARALVELAMDNGAIQGVVSADAALHSGLVTQDELTAEVALVEQWPRSHRAKAMLRLVDGSAESPGESRARCVLVAGGIRLVPQVTIRDEQGEFVARVDFVVEGTKVIVEFDGKVKYVDGNRLTLFEEKKREDRLRALGYTVVRLTWADLERPGLAIAKVRRCMRAA